MKRLGKLVIMTDHEHYCLTTQLEMANGYRDVAENDLRKAEAARDNAIAIARRFHAAGGYSHRLPAVKEQLAHATVSLAHCIDLLVKWRPLVASLETTPGQFVSPKFNTQVAVTRELCGIVGPAWYGLLATPAEMAHDSDVSDPDAGADFDEVGVAVAQERRQP